MSVTAYRRALSVTEQPRASEHRLLSQVTAALSSAQAEGTNGAELVEILHWNREIWSTFSSLCADGDNRLSAPLRAGIISLALWVDRHSSAVSAGRGDIADLIEVNRSIMEGLTAQTPAGS